MIKTQICSLVKRIKTNNEFDFFTSECTSFSDVNLKLPITL